MSLVEQIKVVKDCKDSCDHCDRQNPEHRVPMLPLQLWHVYKVHSPRMRSHHTAYIVSTRHNELIEGYQVDTLALTTGQSETEWG